MSTARITDDAADTLVSLPDDLASCHALIRELLAAIAKDQSLIGKLQQQLERLLRGKYGPKNEKLHPDQLLLFAKELLEQPERPEEPSAPTAARETPVANPPASTKTGHGRKELPKSLPRRRIEYLLEDADRQCPCCGEELEKIGEETAEQLEYVPASLIVLEHARFKYACPHCHDGVTTAAKLPAPIERGLPGPGLLAHVATSKYADHLPLYRQESILARHGVDIRRSTMCDWMARVGELVEPIVKRMRERILASRVIHTDDTPVPVQDDRHPNKTKTGRLWVYLGDERHPYTVFDYTENRSRAGPEAWLKDFRGYLQADAFAGYDAMFTLGAMTEVACWAHARRKFFDAQQTDGPRALVALATIGELYAVERQAKEQEADASLRADIMLSHRQSRSMPILERFQAWLAGEATKVLPKSPIGQAIAYAQTNWNALGRYTDASFLAIDNNAAERALKSVVIGRKNWLFAGSDAGGRTAARIYSLVVTCKRLGLDPFVYLRHVLGAVSTHPHRLLNELLPDRFGKTREPAAINSNAEIDPLSQRP